MKHPARRIAASVCSLLLLGLGTSGCVAGLLYSHTTMPLDVNFEGATRAPDRQGGAWYTIVVPTLVVNPRFDWGSIAIGETMKQLGVETVYYADLEQTSVLGLWNRRRLHIYGE